MSIDTEAKRLADFVENHTYQEIQAEIRNALSERDEELAQEKQWRFAITHLPSEYRDSVLATFEQLKLHRLQKNSPAKQMCTCGEVDTLNGAEVEVGGVCHRPHKPCYVIELSNLPMTVTVDANNYLNVSIKEYEQMKADGILMKVKEVEDLMKEKIGKYNATILNEFQLQLKPELPMLCFDERVALVPAITKAMEMHFPDTEKTLP